MSLKIAARETLLISFSMLLVSSCSGGNQNKTPIIIQTPPMPKEEVIPEISINNKFKILEKPEELEYSRKFGKKDPFNDESSIQSDLFFEEIILKGVINDSKINYALISYNGNIVEIKEGDIGGESNKLIPNGLKVSKIDVKNEVVIFIFDDKEFKISLHPNNKKLPE